MKKVTVIALIFSFLIFLVGGVYAEARNAFYIDPISASTIAGVSYGLMDFWGIGFSVSQGTAAGMQSFLEGQVTDYADSRGGTIAEVFGTAIAKDAAGKLVVGQVTYNAIKDFVESLIEKFGLSDSESVVTPGEADGTFIPTPYSSTDKMGVSAVFSTQKEPSGSYPYMSGFRRGNWYYDGALKADVDKGNTRFALTGNWAIIYDGQVSIGYEELDGKTGSVSFKVTTPVTIPFTLTNAINWNGTDYVEPTVLNPDKEWTGWVDGYSGPDTNLEDLIGGIFEQAATGDISIDGEVIDVPIPPPTPVPVEPDTPLSDVPWEGLNDLIGSTTGTIGEEIQDQTDAITEAQEATTEAVESLSETIEGALDTPSAEDLPEFKFDLRELFPFCIPFDIYRLLSSFDAEPQAPHVQLPIVINSINFRYTLDLDFSAWNPVAQAMRTAELIVYAIGLAWATGKVIKW